MDELEVHGLRARGVHQQVFTLLEGDIPVIASTKARTDILPVRGRSHPNCRVYTVTGEP